jgi:hypothetical protein
MGPRLQQQKQRKYLHSNLTHNSEKQQLFHPILAQYPSTYPNLHHNRTPGTALCSSCPWLRMRHFFRDVVYPSIVSLTLQTRAFILHHNRLSTRMTTDRTQRVPKGGYSTNPSTVKNRMARENKSGEGLELEKAKNAENTVRTHN